MKGALLGILNTEVHVFQCSYLFAVLRRNTFRLVRMDMGVHTGGRPSRYVGTYSVLRYLIWKDFLPCPAFKYLDGYTTREGSITTISHFNKYICFWFKLCWAPSIHSHIRPRRSHFLLRNQNTVQSSQPTMASPLATIESFVEGAPPGEVGNE